MQDTELVNGDAGSRILAPRAPRGGRCRGPGLKRVMAHGYGVRLRQPGRCDSSS